MSWHDENYYKHVYQIPKRIFELELTAAELGILSVLYRHAYDRNNPGQCWPSLSIIKKQANIHTEVLRETLMMFHDAGIITISELETKKHGYANNLYHLKDWSLVDESEISLIILRIEKARQQMRDRLKDKRSERLKNQDTKVKYINKRKK